MNENLLFWLVVCLIGGLLLVAFVGIGLIAGQIASWMGFSGLSWWAVVLVIYMMIVGFIGMLNRIGD